MRDVIKFVMLTVIALFFWLFIGYLSEKRRNKNESFQWSKFFLLVLVIICFAGIECLSYYFNSQGHNVIALILSIIPFVIAIIWRIRDN